MDVKTRFWSKVDKGGGMDACWLWTASRSVYGYGHFKLDGITVVAHRLLWTWSFGPVPKNLVVRHKCDVRHCVNPLHLELGTNADNVADRVARNRSAAGTRNGRTKLTESDVRRIRNMVEQGPNKVAQQFGVHQRTIAAIWTGKSWKPKVLEEGTPQ